MRLYLNENKIITETNNKGVEKSYLEIDGLSLGFKTWLSQLLFILVVYGILILIAVLVGFGVGLLG